MELRRRIDRAALRRPGVLLAVWPGATRERLAVEAELATGDWHRVEAPAAADLLVTVGEPGPGDGEWVERLWAGVPAPRARVAITDVREVPGALDRGRDAVAAQPVAPSAAVEIRENGADGSNGADERHGSHGGAGDGHHGDGHHPAARHRDDQPRRDDDPGAAASPDHGGRHGQEHHHEREHPAGHGRGRGHGHAHGHGQSADGGHHGHHGGVVAGLPMAERADDRDGLRLDQLHVPLGPGLTDWPSGLVLRLTLRGDVVRWATVGEVGPGARPVPPYWSEPWLRAAHGERVTRGRAHRRRCAAHLDSLGRLLAVAGWDGAADRARNARDRAVAGAGAAELTALVGPLLRRTRRSRTLRWLTTGLGRLPAAQARRYGVGGPALAADGDVHDRTLLWLEEAERSAAGCEDTTPLDASGPSAPRGEVGRGVPPSRGLLDALPGLLEGTEFAGARLIVASLDPDLDELVYAPATKAWSADG